MAKTPASAHIERPKHTAYARAAQAEKPGFWTRFKAGLSAAKDTFLADPKHSIMRFLKDTALAFGRALSDPSWNTAEAAKKREKLLKNKGTVLNDSNQAHKEHSSVNKKLAKATQDLDKSKKALDTTTKGLQKASEGLAAQGQVLVLSPEQQAQIRQLQQTVNTKTKAVTHLTQDLHKAAKTVANKSKEKDEISGASVDQAIAAIIQTGHPPGGGFARGTSMASDQAKHASQNRAGPAA